MNVALEELQATVAETFVYAYPMLFDDKTLHEQVLTVEQVAAIDAGVQQGRANLAASVQAAHSSIGYFGTRATRGSNDPRRATAAAIGIYGNNVDEAIYTGRHADEAGRPLIGTNRHEVYFPADGLPPVELFWSITMYALPSRLLVDDGPEQPVIDGQWQEPAMALIEGTEAGRSDG